MTTSLAAELGYPYEEDPFSYQTLVLGDGTSPTREIDRERFLALLEINREIAGRHAVTVVGRWGCRRCGVECTASGGPAGPAGVQLTADPHECRPTGWLRKAHALWSGTGTGTLLLVPEIPRHMVAVVRDPGPRA